MRKTLLLTCFLFISLVLHAKKDTILIFHPTESNLSTIEYLLDNDIFKLSKYHFKGVYHSSETYDYTQSEKYLEVHPGLPFSLKCVNNCLPIDKIYKENMCSVEFKKLFYNSIGAIFLGGPDLPPGTYRESTHLMTRVTDPGRHYLELSYLFHVLGGSQGGKPEALMNSKPGYGILGICLGMQSINVATGGSMIQDIPHEVYNFSFAEEVLDSDPSAVHKNYYPREPGNKPGKAYYTSYHFHPIQLLAGFPGYSNKKANLAKHPYVLSSHHQAIQDIGHGLIPVALSMDGKIIEAVVHKEFNNVFGVQFHPEKTGLYDQDQVFRITSDSAINFNHYILENDSHAFHLNLWKSAAKLFK